jgi:hypothetical protein
MAGVATKLRGILDETISGLEGPGYQQLKNQYGQLKAIEKDVVKRMITDKRAANSGFFDLSDMFSASKLVTGILKSEPSTAAAGGTMLAIKQFLKMGNNPNLLLKKMFNKVDKHLPPEQKFAGPFERELGFTMPGRTPDGITNPRSLTPSGPVRNTMTPESPIIEGQFTETTPLPGMGPRPRLDSPRGGPQIQVPWNPVNNPGGPANRMGNINSKVSDVDIKAMAKSLYEKGFPPSEIQRMIFEQLKNR